MNGFSTPASSERSLRCSCRAFQTARMVLKTGKTE